MIPSTYPSQQSKTEAVIIAQRVLGRSKVNQESIAEAVVASSESAVTRQIAKAIAKSNRHMAEDLLRESGYMLPQSKEVRELLEAMLKNGASDFPKETVKLLLNKLQKTS
jgi:hypothetical protein